MRITKTPTQFSKHPNFTKQVKTTPALLRQRRKFLGLRGVGLRALPPHRYCCIPIQSHLAYVNQTQNACH